MDSLAKGNMPATHISEANVWKDLYDRLRDCSVADKLMDGTPIGLLKPLQVFGNASVSS